MARAWLQGRLCGWEGSRRQGSACSVLQGPRPQRAGVAPVGLQRGRLGLRRSAAPTGAGAAHLDLPPAAASAAAAITCHLPSPCPALWPCSAGTLAFWGFFLGFLLNGALGLS